ncbi:MAG TPA: hypothetical protein VJ773_06775 [Gemmatimonadales bacterium]|nr:hypothetical protein [Gemmatimonadales bacterium]
MTREFSVTARPSLPLRTRSRAFALLLAVSVLPGAASAGAQSKTEVFVLATLYQRHATTPAYSHDSLRAIILRIDPAVVVLDVSPTELRDRTVAPSKAEYPEVIFPLVAAEGYQAYAGEPDEPTFTEIVTGLGEALRRFRSEQPALAEADKAFGEAAFAALSRLWQSPADVNSAATDQVLRARREYQDRLAGPAVAEAWRRWNDHALGVVAQARADNPERRILVLIGVENCGPLRQALGQTPGVTLVDVEAWLRRT